MKILIHVPLILSLFACGPRTEQHTNEVTNTQDSDTVGLAELLEVNVPTGQTSNKENTDTLRSPFHKSYYSDIPLRTVAELVLNDSIQPLDNDLTFSLMEQITSEDKSTRDYFFPTFKLIVNKADGALAEAVGMYAKQYAEQYPNEFLSKFRCCNTDSTCCNDLIKFSDFIRYEIGMATDIDQAYSDFHAKINAGERKYPNDQLTKLLVDNIANGLDEFR